MPLAEGGFTERGAKQGTPLKRHYHYWLV